MVWPAAKPPTSACSATGRKTSASASATVRIARLRRISASVRMASSTAPPAAKPAIKGPSNRTSVSCKKKAHGFPCPWALRCCEREKLQPYAAAQFRFGVGMGGIIAMPAIPEEPERCSPTIDLQNFQRPAAATCAKPHRSAASGRAPAQSGRQCGRSRRQASSGQPGSPSCCLVEHTPREWVMPQPAECCSRARDARVKCTPQTKLRAMRHAQ